MIMKIRRSSLGLVVALIGIWLALGIGVVPHLIESAYSGESFSFLNQALVPYGSIPVDFILAQWADIVALGALSILLLSALAYVLGLPGTARRVVGKATPGDIGAIRILVCGVLLVSTLWEDLASTAALPREQIRPMGILQVLYMLPIGFDRFAASPTALLAFEWLTAAVLFLALIGWKSRWTVPAGAVCYLIFGGMLRQYAWFYHTGLLGLYLLAILALLPSHHGRSVDRLLKLRKGEPVPPEIPSIKYGWMRFALWTTFAVPYVMAGLSKLRNGGLAWWDASNFKYILYQSSLRPMEFDFDLSLLFTSAPNVVFEGLALAALGGEILYGLVLFSRRARWIMPSIMLLMHIGILLMQNILFFDLIILQAIFFNFRPLDNALKSAVARGKERLLLLLQRDNLRLLRLRRLLLPRVASIGPEQTPSGSQPPLLPRSGGPRLTLVLTGVLTLIWLFRVEFYPLTGMQMFSKKRSEPVTYELLLARMRSGEVIRAPVEKSIKAMSDGRYRRVLEMAFDPEREHVAAAFLDTIQNTWNRNVTDQSSQIDHFEVQRWEWHYLADPDSPTFGRLVLSKIYPVDETNASTTISDTDR